MEWLIDIIKEWVIAKAYATEAWVLTKLYATEVWVHELVTLVNVTGDIAPDATGSYVKHGTYNGMPYYRRTDGAYFIWWRNEIGEWLISTARGVTEPGYWTRAVSIKGLYLAMGAYEGPPIVTEGRKFLRTGFVDRGDPATVDFEAAAFTADDAWHELDLSSIVPENAKGVCLAGLVMDNAVNSYLHFRTAGNSNDKNKSDLVTQAANIWTKGDLTIPLDANRKIEYRSAAVSWIFINLTVKAWWF